MTVGYFGLAFLKAWRVLKSSTDVILNRFPQVKKSGSFSIYGNDDGENDDYPWGFYML
jgi:hypothetical protein